jgi:hypothetical protein
MRPSLVLMTVVFSAALGTMILSAQGTPKPPRWSTR